MGIEFNKLNNLFALSGKQINADETKSGKKAGEVEVPVGKPKTEAEKETVGLDTFVRTTEVAETKGAEALAAYNKVNLNNKTTMVNTSPKATEARMEQAFAANAKYLASVADELGVGAAATVNGIDNVILSKINVTPLLASYLNSADQESIEQSMQGLLQFA